MVMFARPVNLFVDADALVEADQIGAAAEEDVLAVVDDLVDAGMQVGAGAAAEVASLLDEMYLKSAPCNGAGGGHAGYASADDDHGFFCAAPHQIQWYLSQCRLLRSLSPMAATFD